MTFISKYSESEMAMILDEYHSGANRKQLCNKYGITVRTLFRWQERSGFNRPKLINLISDLHEENARLKRLLEEKHQNIGDGEHKAKSEN